MSTGAGAAKADGQITPSTGTSDDKLCQKESIVSAAHAVRVNPATKVKASVTRVITEAMIVAAAANRDKNIKRVPAKRAESTV